jgi:RimJ/RimL family protein N-acetyltransferase
MAGVCGDDSGVDAMMDVPVLETERLRLRGHRVEDYPALADLWGNEGTVRFIGGKVSNGEEAWARLLRYAGLWALMGYGYWVVEDKVSGEYMGECGFAEYHREIVPAIIGRPEAGWVFAAEAQGKGYATEAMRAVLAWGQERFGDGRSVCLIQPKNVASLRVAEKLGFLEEARVMFHGKPAVLLARG